MSRGEIFSGNVIGKPGCMLNLCMPEVKMVEPDSTYLMWLDFRAWGMDCEQIDAFFRSAGVALNKGSTYGEGAEGFMRINVACTREVLESAMEDVYNKYKEVFLKK